MVNAAEAVRDGRPQSSVRREGGRDDEHDLFWTEGDTTGEFPAIWSGNVRFATDAVEASADRMRDFLRDKEGFTGFAANGAAILGSRPVMVILGATAAAASVKAWEAGNVGVSLAEIRLSCRPEEAYVVNYEKSFVEDEMH